MRVSEIYLSDDSGGVEIGLAGGETYDRDAGLDKRSGLVGDGHSLGRLDGVYPGTHR